MTKKLGNAEKTRNLIFLRILPFGMNIFSLKIWPFWHIKKTFQFTNFCWEMLKYLLFYYFYFRIFILEFYFRIFNNKLFSTGCHSQTTSSAMLPRKRTRHFREWKKMKPEHFLNFRFRFLPNRERLRCQSSSFSTNRSAAWKTEKEKIKKKIKSVMHTMYIGIGTTQSQEKVFKP